MSKRLTLGQIRTLLLRLPESEREPILRHGELRKVEGNDEVKDDKNNPKGLQSIFYRTLHSTPPSKTLRHRDCSPKPDVPSGKNGAPKKSSQSPISNYPSYDEIDGGVPNSTQMEIFSLRRQNSTLTAKLAAANDKLTDALECLFSQRRFLQLWVTENQGESFDKLHARIKRIQATIDHIENRNTGPSPELELPERWKSKT